jgi:hypothetical protein
VLFKYEPTPGVAARAFVSAGRGEERRRIDI